jgi:trehalose 6-phosphate phosphatase
MQMNSHQMRSLPADGAGVNAGPTLPPLTRQTALFLDFDGTLVDIASEPELVSVPAGLVDLLDALSRQLDGALAIVSGRELADLDRYLSPLQLPTAGEHGAVHRHADGRIEQLAAPPLQDVQRVAQALAAEHAGLRVEVKSAAVALHYRHAPQLQDLCLLTMAEAVKRTPGVELIKGKFVFEVKPAAASKGSAISSFMAQAPFAGRVAVFAGDDTTDESGFAVIRTLGGNGIKVGTGESLADLRCPSPAAFRDWLKNSLQGTA